MESDVTTTLVRIAAVGVGATAIMDAWALVQKAWLGVPSFDYRLVGRWIGHLPRGRLVHDGIARSEPVRGEAPLGWTAHYAIGVIFCAILVAIWGTDWLVRPTLLPALIVGIGSIIAPFFILQPGLGAGIAASRTPAPWLARFRSLVAHTSFAVGLYLSALLLSRLPVILQN